MDTNEDSRSDRPYRLPKELLDSAREAESSLRRSIEYVDGRYMPQRQVTVVHLRWEGREGGGGDVNVTAGDLLQFLMPVTRGIGLDSAEPTPRPAPAVSFRSRAAKNILRFIELYFDEIRRLICKGNPRNLGATTHAALVALSAWLAKQIGAYEGAVTAMASAILIAILTATKGAFCRMTAEAAKAALEQAL
jgi:hypothetical protein